jgi:LacI family transcriptional regulator
MSPRDCQEGSATASASTIFDVARTAGVSTATVSRVLNNNPRVDPHLVVKVRNAVDALSYRPSSVARSLSTQRTHVWALIISDIRNPFFTDMVRGVEHVAYSAGYSLFLCNSEEDPVKEASYLELAIAEHARGVIIIPSNSDADVTTLMKLGTSVVAADRRLNNQAVDCVLVDNLRGAKQAVAHLIESGYDRIAHITGSLDSTTGNERYTGYRLALEEAGQALDDSLVRMGSYRESGGHEAMRDLLSLPHAPDAVFVGNNLMTMGALHAIDEAGLIIPDELGVVGFDDMSWSSLVRPPLTTIAQPVYDLGVATAQLLLSRIEGYSGTSRTVTLSPSLIVRESSTPKAQLTSKIYPSSGT